MAKPVEIEIEIDPAGEVKMTVKGRKGPSCLEFLDLMSEKLGKIKHKEFTSEYYETAETEGGIQIDQDQ